MNNKLTMKCLFSTLRFNFKLCFSPLSWLKSAKYSPKSTEGPSVTPTSTSGWLPLALASGNSGAYLIGAWKGEEGIEMIG